MIWIAGPLQWRTQPMPAWNPPPGFSLLDLRSLPDHAEGTSGRAVFYGNGSIPSEYDLIGSGSWADLKPTGRTLAALPKRAGFAPTGDTLRDQLLSILTDGADPAGLDGPRPILPTSERRTEFHAGGQSLSRAFALNNGTHANRVRDVLRADFAAIHADATGGKTRDPEIHRRVLDYWCKQYGIEDWREFVPANLRAHIPGRLPHETTITETFTGSIGSALGPNLTWTSISGSWRIGSSNAAGKTATNSVVDLARADTDLSSADQRAQIKRLGTNTAHYQGACVRVPSTSTKTFYGVFNDSFIYIMKMVAGTQTNITNTANAAVSGDIYKVSANGSTIKSYCNGTEKLSTTDTAITGNLRTGIQLFTAVDDALDDFEAADLLTHYTVTAAQGSFSLSGQAAGLKAGRAIAASQGAFALTGQAAGLKAGRTLSAAQGSFALSGQAAGLLATRAVAGAVGAFALSGQAAGLLAARSLSAAQGSFAVSGQTAGLQVARGIVAAVGTFAVSGQAAALRATRQIAAALGTFAITGIDAALSIAGRISAAGTLRRPRWSWPRLWLRAPASWRRAIIRPRHSIARTLRYAPMSSRIEPTTLTKPAGETRRIAFDLSTSPESVAGETFSSPSILGGSGLTFGTPTVSSGVFDGIAAGKAVLVTVSGGSAGTTYDFALQVTASGGSILVVNGRITVTDNY